MYLFWDALPANSIVCAALEFVNGCALENHADIQNIVPCSSSPSWPYYLRAKTGVAPAYSFMIFTKNVHPKLSHFIQAIADINLFIDLTNDTLSFYKESMDNEEGNYVTNRSLVHGKPPIRVLSEVADEAYAAYSRVSKSLKTQGTPEAYKAWMTFVHGYITFHVTQGRYRLEELNI
ncbi:isoprenoid synthase domain-containing protein [Collybia nuda]|uniref:Isoprenoid synthase domain-containing protein n=1 Tax=Collybia nuda TaxID=64659 RepID=A0A9P5YGU8_9AGAR|nr:isoprenoid synthase domain-containing protein [Collybia nuda]